MKTNTLTISSALLRCMKKEIILNCEDFHCISS